MRRTPRGCENAHAGGCRLVVYSVRRPAVTDYRGDVGKVLAEWPDRSLRICEHPDGLWIEQAGGQYLARDWRMTVQVRQFVEAALATGLETVIRTTHPQPNNRSRGVRYIAFSRTPYERWIVTLDQYSPASGRGDGVVRQFTVEQSYRSAVERAGILYRQERGGGKNLYVPFDHHRELLATVRTSIDEVERALGARDWQQIKDEIGFITEAVLETALLAAWSKVPALAALDVIANQIRSMDVLARHRGSGSLVVFELKRSIASVEVLGQLKRYVAGPAQAYSAGHEIWGALVARSYAPGVLEGALSIGFPIALFQFAGTPSDIQIEEVRSTWPS